MHEFAICGSILTTAVQAFEALDPRPPGLCRVRVVCGGLHQIVPDYLQQAWRLLSDESPARGATLELVITPVTVRCRGCDWQGQIEPPLFMCAACGEFSVELTGGHELYLETMEVNEHEDA